MSFISLKDFEPLMWMTFCFISFFVSLYSIFGDWSFLLTLILAGFLGGLQSRSAEVGALSGLFAALLGSIVILMINTLLFELGLTLNLNFGEPSLINYVLRFGVEDFMGTIIIIEVAMLSMGAFGTLGGYLGSQSSLYVFDRSNRVSFKLQTYCPRCGRNLMSSDRFCPNCGINLLQMVKLT